MTIRGLEVAYCVHGMGYPIFCVHGWGGSKESFDDIRMKLDSSRFCVVALDMPGFGESDIPTEPFTMSDYVNVFFDFVKAFMKKNHMSGQYALMVHSFGGRVALKQFLMNKGGDISHLILIASAGLKSRDSFKKRVGRFLASVGSKICSLPYINRCRVMFQRLLYKALRVHDYEGLCPVMRETFKNVIDEDMRESFEEIHCPTLIVWGDRDTYVPVSDAYELHENIKNSQLIVLEGGRHGIHHTHATELARYVTTFISGGKFRKNTHQP